MCNVAEVVGPGGKLSEDQIQDLRELALVAGAYLRARRSGRMSDMEDSLLSLEILTEDYLAKWYPDGKDLSE